jgi:hypothetical protein
VLESQQIVKVAMSVHCADPASTVIELLGGRAVVAQALGLHRSSLLRWCSESGGSRGQVPLKHWPALLALAESKGIELNVSDLIKR